MLKLLRYAALILGANFFFPVSCTSFLFVGTIAGSKLDERDVSKGDTVHEHFVVAVEPGEAGRSFRVLNLSELEEPKKRPATFLLSKSEAQATTDHARMSYKILEDTDQKQLVEVMIDDLGGDWTHYSRYRASQDSVKPVWSKLVYVGQMFAAIPWAVVAALVLHITGRCLRRRLDRVPKPPAA